MSRSLQLEAVYLEALLYSERVVEQARSLKCFVEVNAMVQVMKLPGKLRTLYWFPKLYVPSTIDNKLMLWHNQAIYMAKIASLTGPPW